KLIATLYADDAIVSLSENDSYDALKALLERWCIASGAKFNIAKTEIIPMGTAEYRAHLRESMLNGDD
ncbi:hypothetical protein AURDEDRAFT_34404, partial [Auricularia subglabra TFB-10046 SS5]